MKEHKGACEYCGQIYTFEGPDDLTEKEINREATMHCDCRSAIVKQNEEKFKITAYGFIDMMIRQEDIQSVMKQSADLIAEHKAGAVTITAGGTKYSIKRSSSGPKVEVTTTEKETME